MTAGSRWREAAVPGDFGRVAVLYGGRSAEREVSLVSGKAVLAALRAQGVDATGIDTGDGVGALVDGRFDRVFIALHGRGGEDGTVQGLLECLSIPYTGSGVLGCALSMDKIRTKRVWQAVGVPTLAFAAMAAPDEAASIVEALGLPLCVKPVHEGSSVGLSKVRSAAELAAAWGLASRYDTEVLVEPWVTGPEYTVSLLHDALLPEIRIETPHEFYDYEAKYADGAGTRYLIPSGLDAPAQAELQALCRRAFESVAVSGWGRVDLMIDADGRYWFLDVNVAPGMTSHSLVPMAARAANLDYERLVWRILETSLR